MNNTLSNAEITVNATKRVVRVAVAGGLAVALVPVIMAWTPDWIDRLVEPLLVPIITAVLNGIGKVIRDKTGWEIIF